MVTIEDKLKLFSKLLNQSMDKELTDSIKELEYNYESKIQKYKDEADKEARDIEEKARKKAETKRAESISKSKVIIKKDIMALKEKYYYIFMGKFNEKLNEFIKSAEYKYYLSKLISNLIAEIKGYENKKLIIYLSKNDMDNYSDFINSEIKNKLNLDVSLKTNYDMKGGLIAELEGENLKIDSSLDAVLEDNKTYIMKTIFETLEAGDYNG